MLAQRTDIDAHERDAQQCKDRLGDERLEQLAKRRHANSNEDQRGKRAGALAA
jgi:hypothetical protein